MRWQQEKMIFFPLSFQIRQFQCEGTGTLQIQHSVLGVLSIRKMSVNARDYRNHQETITNLAEQAGERKNLNVFRQLGIHSMANQWASVVGNVMTAETCFPGCKHDGYHTYKMAQGKMANHIKVKLVEKVLPGWKSEMENPIKKWISLLVKG